MPKESGLFVTYIRQEIVCFVLGPLKRTCRGGEKAPCRGASQGDKLAPVPVLHLEALHGSPLPVAAGEMTKPLHFAMPGHKYNRPHIRYWRSASFRVLSCVSLRVEQCVSRPQLKHRWLMSPPMNRIRNRPDPGSHTSLEL